MNGTLSNASLMRRYRNEPIECREGTAVCKCNGFVLSGRNRYAIVRHFGGRNHTDYVARRRNEDENEDEDEGESNDDVAIENDNVADNEGEELEVGRTNVGTNDEVALENDVCDENQEELPSNDEHNADVPVENNSVDNTEGGESNSRQTVI